MEIKHLIQIARTVSEGKVNDTAEDMFRHSADEIQAEISHVQEKRELALKILYLLFKDNIPINVYFYSKLTELLRLIGFNKPSYQLIAIILIEAYKQLEPPEAEKLLNFIAHDDVDVFLFIKSLPNFLEEIELSSDFASHFFKSVDIKIRGDLASGDFYTAVEKYSIAFPQAGLRVLGKYFEEGFDDGTLHLAAIILGYIRAVYLKNETCKHDIKLWDRRLSGSINSMARVSYHRSWAFTYLKGDISYRKLALQLSKMLGGNDDEISEAFGVLQKCLSINISNTAFVNFLLNWLDQNATPQVPTAAKHLTVEIIWRLCESAKQDDTILSKLNNLLLIIQPIPQENKGTWNTVGYYLHKVLQIDKRAFSEALLGLIDLNPDGIIQHFEDNTFSYVIAAASKTDLTEVVADLLFSHINHRRAVGVKLYNALKTLTFSQELLTKYDVKLLLNSLMSFSIRAYQGEDIATFLLLLEPRFRDEESAAREDFKREMIYQAINYPGTVLDAFKKVDNPSELLSEIICSAENYFIRIEKLNESPVNSFAFAGFDEATAKAYQDFSSQIYEGAKEKSILAQLARNVHIIYGNTFSFVIQDKINSPSKFSSISHSIEFPRIEIIDPEGTAIRRLQMLKNMQGSDN